MKGACCSFAIVERAWTYDPEERAQFADLLPELETLRGCPFYQVFQHALLTSPFFYFLFLGFTLSVTVNSNLLLLKLIFIHFSC